MRENRKVKEDDSKAQKKRYKQSVYKYDCQLFVNENTAAIAHSRHSHCVCTLRTCTCDYPEQEGGGVVRPHQAVDGLEEPLQ